MITLLNKAKASIGVSKVFNILYKKILKLVLPEGNHNANWA
jgi:hypothetical protein